MELEGKNALVTGGARRIGAAIARDLAAHGVGVVVHCNHSTEEAEGLADELRAKGATAWSIRGDLDHLDADAFFHDLLALTGGRLDLLVNNASTYPASDLLTTTGEEIAGMVRVHASTPLALVQRFAALPHPGGGSVVNLLDARITTYDKGHVAYHLSKRMLFSLTRMLALELAPAIRVNAVAPGAVLQEVGQPPSELERLAQFNPMKSHGSPEGLAECVRFLLASDFITGQILYYDGGYHMKAATYG